MLIDPRLIFCLLVFATVFSFGQAAWGLFGVRQARKAVNRRLATVERTGSLGDIACLSFYPTKNLGAYGDAGMVVTNSAEIAARLRTLRNHGQTARYVSSEPGWNSRLDELQAAILRVKLRHLADWQRARQSHAAEYTRQFSQVPGVMPPIALEGYEHAYHHPEKSHRENLHLGGAREEPRRLDEDEEVPRLEPHVEAEALARLDLRLAALAFELVHRHRAPVIVLFVRLVHESFASPRRGSR